MKKLFLILGLCFLLYPYLSNYYNSKHQSQVIETYFEEVNSITEDDLSDAYEYNDYLLSKNNRFSITYDEHLWYESLLNIHGVMGTIVIPKINVSYPIYHSVSESVLQVAIGHLEGSSLPVLTSSTHCVLMGHRALPSARLFTDLDQIEIGDEIIIHVLDNEYTYIVDQINVVEPNDYSLLNIEENKNYISLITCTPYGKNTHRLIVRGVYHK